MTGQETFNGSPVGETIEPRLVNPGGGGTIGDPTQLSTLDAYRLQPDSPLVNRGGDLRSLFGIDTGVRDFYGSSLPQRGAYDVGAHEMQ